MFISVLFILAKKKVPEITKLFNIREWLTALEYVCTSEHYVVDKMDDVHVNVLIDHIIEKIVSCKMV